VALAAGVGVQRLYSEQLSQAQQRYGHLRDDYALLQAQFKQVEAQLAQLQERCGYYPLVTVMRQTASSAAILV
jgi:hypothetical protein